MKSIRNSQSTDCFSSDENKSKSNKTIDNHKNTNNKKSIKINLIGITRNSRNYFASYLLNKINEKNIKIINDENSLLIHKRCKSSLNIKEKIMNSIGNKFINFSIGKTKGLFTNITSRNNYLEECNDEILNNNSYFRLQDSRNKLENNIIELEKDLSFIIENLDLIIYSISEHKNQNQKIMLIQQRYEIQMNYTRKEIFKIKDELIKVFCFFNF